MAKTMAEIQAIASDFSAKYIDGERVHVVGVSTVGMHSKKPPEGFSASDYCLSVGLLKRPRIRSPLPAKFQGVLVFYKIIGKVVPA